MSMPPSLFLRRPAPTRRSKILGKPFDLPFDEGGNLFRNGMNRFSDIKVLKFISNTDDNGIMLNWFSISFWPLGKILKRVQGDKFKTFQIFLLRFPATLHPFCSRANPVLPLCHPVSSPRKRKRSALGRRKEVKLGAGLQNVLTGSLSVVNIATYFRATHRPP